MSSTQITVISETGKKIGMTYERRAMQLVNKNRARWHNEKRTAICLFEQPDSTEPPVKEKEHERMDTRADYAASIDVPRSNRLAPSAHDMGYSVASMPEFSAMIDEDLYKLAKQSLFDRFALIMHWGAFVFSQIVFLIIGSIMWRVGEFLLFVDALWLVGIAMHTLYYFARITPVKIQKEYNKLSRHAKR